MGLHLITLVSSISTLLNKVQKVMLLVIIVLLSIVWILVGSLQRSAKINNLKEQTIQSYKHNSVLWKDKNNKLTITSAIQFHTIQSLKKTTDSTILSLINKNKAIGNKLKHTEYLLNVQLGVNIDTVTKVQYFYVTDTTYVEIDSLQIQTLTIKRFKNSNSDIARYSIKYNPELFISINHYKEGNWKLKNLFVKRPIIYKVDLQTNDSILKPRNLTVVKLIK